jgi:uncharacterized protein involved in exopolysaccharide biosynthesis
VDGLADTPWQRRPALPTMAGYFALVWSQIAVIAVTTGLGALIGVVLALRLPHTYEAAVEVDLPGLPTWVSFDPEEDAPQRTTIDSSAQLVLSDSVVRSVAAVTHLETDEVRQNLRVSAYPLSRVLVPTFRASSAELAVSGADAAAKALIHQRKRVFEGSQIRVAVKLKRYLDRLLPEANRKGGPYSSVTHRLLEEITQINDVRQEAAAESPQILKDAAPAQAVRPHGELQVVTGATLGFLCGLGYAWWSPGRRRSGRSVRNAWSRAPRRGRQSGAR